jgi:hypothetical protein
MAAGHQGPAKRGQTEADKAAEVDARQGRARESLESEPGLTCGVTSKLLSKMGVPRNHHV